MNNSIIFLVKFFRKLYSIFFEISEPSSFKREENPDNISKIIFNSLISDKPCMIARFGSTELACMTNYYGITQGKKNVIDYIKGDALPWWWNKSILNQMQVWSGFFPPTIEKIVKFCKLMNDDMEEIDILGSWLNAETYFNEKLVKSEKVAMPYLDPFFTKIPWTKALEGKKVLVVHPFENTINSQYMNKELLFENKDILPSFELKTIRAVQSIAGEKTEFNDWFDALNWMKNEIDKVDYDICLLACGAYGLPLAAHIKRNGKKAVHMGGSLQLLFGIKGARWDLSRGFLYNKYWVRPSEEEKPQMANSVENACYW